MYTKDDAKNAAAIYASQFVENGMTIGLGTGTTVYWLIEKLAKDVKEGLEFSAVPSSKQTEQLAISKGIELVSLDSVDFLDLVIDGADEIDHEGRLIKGGGGALLQEKIVADSTNDFIIIADESKFVKKLGKFPLPVEVVPYAWSHVRQRIHQGYPDLEITLRTKNDAPFITDHGHYILDCSFGVIDHPAVIDMLLHGYPGVVETGLFISRTTKAVIGKMDGSVAELNFPKE